MSNSITRKEDLKHFTLIHYGASSYDPDIFQPITDDEGRTKPRGGLWTSPVDSKWGWKDWAESESWGDLLSHFVIDYVGKTFVVDSVEDASRLPWTERESWRGSISFETLVGMGYDAIHLTENGEKETRFPDEFSLYGWDCETVLIFNPDSIVNVSRCA